MNGATTHLALGPELTIYTAAQTGATLLAALRATPELVLDLSQVCDIDSAGVQLLLAATQRAGCSVRLEHHASAVQDTLAMLGLDLQLSPL